MAKAICTLLGIVFLLVGLLGFVSPGFMGTHLNVTHNIVHILSAAVALYLGLRGTLSAARTFCLVFGPVYLLLGLAGFLFGGGGQHTVAGVPGTHGSDSRLLAFLPGSLELGTMDHIFHVLLGIIFLLGYFLTRVDYTPPRDRA